MPGKNVTKAIRSALLVATLSLVAGCWLCCQATDAWQPVQEGDDHGLKQGWLFSHREVLQRLLALRVDRHSRLQLDRAVWNKHARSAAEREQEMIDSYMQRGMDEEQARQMVMRRRMGAQRQTPGILSQSAFADIAQQVIKQAGRVSQRQSAGNTSYSASFHNDEVLGVFTSRMDTHEIVFMDGEMPRRTLTVHDDGKGGFFVTLISRELIVRLSQPQNMPFEVMIADGENAFRATTPGFRDFEREYPEQFQRLLDILGHVGFAAPLLQDSPEVVALVKQLLGDLHGGASDEFHELLTGLDSSDFDIREAARQQLGDNFAKYAGLIRAKLSEDGNSLEVKNALSSLVRIGSQPQENPRAWEFVVSESLVSSPSYLVSLLPGASAAERAIIVRQLQKVTGEQLGEDVQAWQEYMTTAGQQPDDDDDE